VIFQDLTKLREMEAAVQRAERLADLGRLSAALAHEIRNPLASMTGSIELLHERPGLGGEDRRLMEIVLREASRLDQLVSQFLAFARPAPLVRRRVDLAELLEETLAVFVHDPLAGRLRIDREASPAAVEGDPDQLRQVLWNLLANASQAMAGEGAPARGERIRVACGADPEGGGWLEVEDDGPGMAPRVRERLFLPFFTTKPSGTGLGLATVHRIVDAHGGAISVESAPGRGARFRVRLPRGSAPPDLR
jgi:two-component system sensor histidine kinase PilS (NtrC family)